MDAFLYFACLACIFCSVVLIRFFTFHSYLPYVAAFIEEYGMSREEFMKHFSATKSFQADLVNLLDWTPFARARFIMDRVHVSIYGKVPDDD